MAEPFGIVAGAFGIAVVFSTCVECFEYVQFARHFGRDFQTSYLELGFARLRLTRWGEAVNVYGDPKLGKPNATPADTKMASDILMQILVLFAETEKISKRYELSKSSPTDSHTTQTKQDLEPKLKTVDFTIKKLVRQRQKGVSLLKKTTWALHHSAEFQALITNITKLIGNLETLFPAPMVQLQLAKDDAAQFQAREDLLELVNNVAGSVDNMLQAAAKQALGGHSYNRVLIAGEGMAINGDSIGTDWEGGLIGALHDYDNIQVQGNARVVNGNKYGGRDIFD
jgi:hypothetical protein